MLDPTQAIIAPWMQYGILGSVVIGLGIAMVMLYRALQTRTEAHLADVRACSAEKMELIKAIGEFKEIVKAALDVVKTR